MKTRLSTFFNENSLRYIQKTLQVSREELIKTIRHSHISADVIAQYLRERKDHGSERAIG